MKIATRIRPSTRCWTQLCSALPTVSVATASGRMKNRPMPTIAVMLEHQDDAALAELDAVVLRLEPGGPDEPAGADDERLVQHDEAADERPARDAVAVEAGVEPLGREDDAAVGVAERDGDGVATAHHDALDERLAAVVEAGHGPKSSGWLPGRPVVLSGGASSGRERRRPSGGHRGGLRAAARGARAPARGRRGLGPRARRRRAVAGGGGRRAPAGRVDRRRPDAADAAGRGPAGRDRGAAARARHARPRAQPVRRARVRERAARGRGGRRGLPAEGPRRGRPRVHGRPRPGGRAAGRRWTRRSSPS